MFRIGEFSKMSKTTIKTLRYYDEIGILKPEVIDKFTGYRLYTSKQLVTLHRIQSYRQIGLSIADIMLALDGKDINDILEKRKSEVEEEIKSAKEQLLRLVFLLECVEYAKKGKDDLFMNYVATIKEVPECIVYSTKMKVSGYDEYFSLIPPIGEKVVTRYPDLKASTPEYCYIVYLDGEYKEKDFNVEFCEAVDQMKEDFEDIHFKKEEAVTVVSIMHKGPYSSLSQAYTYAFQWIEKNGYRATDVPRENFIDGIWNKESEEEWLTELQIPIERVL